MCSSIPKPKFPVAEKFLSISDAQGGGVRDDHRSEMGEDGDIFMGDGSGREWTGGYGCQEDDR